MGESKTLILIDGHALAFRQYYALERTNMKTKDGTPTWAVYGFFKAIFDLLKNENLAPDSIGVAFDVSHHTFRTEKYVEYKANREAMPDPMRVQMGLIYEGLKAFNIPIYTKEGFEADDVIGTISRRACELGHKVYILTGDQDSFQLIRQNGCIKVIIPSKGELIEYDWNKVYEKLGVYPDQVIDTIVQDVDIPFDFEKTNIELPDIATVTDFLRSMQFYSFLKNIEFILKSFDKTDTITIPEEVKNSSQIITPSSNNGQLGLFAQAVQAEVNKEEISYEAKLITDEIDFNQMIAELSEKSVFAFRFSADVENALNSTVYGLSIAYNNDFAFKDGAFNITESDAPTKTYYIPLNHHLEKQLAPDFVMAGLKVILENSDIKKITHDLKQEYNICKSFGINMAGIVFDTVLASYIKDSNASTEFDIQCMERINHILPTMVSENKKAKFNDFDIDTVKNFTSDSIASLFRLVQYWNNELDEKEHSILSEIEIPLAHVLADMEYTGVAVDEVYLTKLTEEFNNKLHRLETKIYNLADEGFNINSPKQVGAILFDKLQLKSPKKRGKAKNSTSAEVLTALAEEYEIARLILEYRKYAKLKSTYTEALPMLIDKKDSRIHTTYNQTTTTTGRLSSSNPNLQNIPVRSEEGNKIRQAFVPQDRQNYLIMSADYSQIELRLLAHVSEDKHLIDAFCSGVDVHTLTASKVFDVPIEEVTKEMRYKAKAVNFGIVYGQSKYGLAKALKITPAEAESFIAKYFETYSSIQAYMLKMVELVEEQGYVETIFGRRRYLRNEINSSNAMVREFAKRAAINHPMQGSASDLIKIAMIDFSKKLKDNNLKSKLIIQVHDELVVEVEKSELELVKSLVLESMELNQPLRVPLLVDINVGESWKES